MTTGPTDLVPDDSEAAFDECTVPLETVDPAAKATDLAPLRDRVTDRTVVGLGEATHGTREFVRLKHGILRYLVEDAGYRLFAWEANFAATLPIDAYVREGRGDPADLLARETIHWPFRSESVVSLLEWLRSFNEGRPADDQVRVYGFDMQYPADAATRLTAFLDDVDPALLASVRDDLAALADSGAVEMFIPQKREHLVNHAARVVDALETPFESRLSTDTIDRTYHRARQCLRTLAQWVDQRHSDNPLAARDKAMADNVDWILAHEPHDNVAVWGHNAHVKRGTVGGGALDVEARAMGAHLDERHGGNYYVLGTEFGGGTVRVHSKPENEFHSHAVDAPPEGSIPDVFGRIDSAPFIFEPDAVPEESGVAEWLDGEPQRHVVVGSYDDHPVRYAASTLTSFDGVAFVPVSTPTIATDQLYTNLDHPDV